MDIERANRSCEEDYAEYQLQTKQPQQETQEAADTQNTGWNEETIDPQDLPEYIYVDADILDYYLKCRLCLGTLTEVRAVKACGHRFCKGCIAASIRFGNKTCPFCRAPCSSFRATVDDANLDGFIKHVLPYIEQEDYELTKEDKARNEELQASISAIKSRQDNSKRKRND